MVGEVGVITSTETQALDSPKMAQHIDDINGEVVSHQVHQPDVVRPDDALSICLEELGDDLPKGYFYSIQFLGAMAGFCFSALSAYIFLLLPTNVLAYINADIGG